MTMIGAIVTHVRMGETDRLAVPLVLLALTLFVAIERFGAPIDANGERSSRASGARGRHAGAGGAGTTKPSSQKATCVSMRSTIHPKFMPKNPVMNVSGTKIVATTLTR